MNELLSKYPQDIEKILAKYPADQKRSAVMPLLFLAQRKEGYIRTSALSEIGEILGIQGTEVATLVGFYTLFHDHEAGSYRIQVCTDLCCALRGAEEFLVKLCQALEIQPGETTPDGLVTVEEVKCQQQHRRLQERHHRREAPLLPSGAQHPLPLARDGPRQEGFRPGGADILRGQDPEGRQGLHLHLERQRGRTGAGSSDVPRR